MMSNTFSTSISGKTQGSAAKYQYVLFPLITDAVEKQSVA